MPKITNTRKQRASELLARLERGPHFDSNPDGTSYTPGNAQEQYQLWVNSWIIGELIDLIPELRQMEKEGKV